mmetsp:Transcript_11219/g.18029  ORF Transcript_11219/g.18029 Transcript_11219/m.18029 type:complete len:210 (+) Transcript_11219:1222-1851(+)
MASSSRLADLMSSREWRGRRFVPGIVALRAMRSCTVLTWMSWDFCDGEPTTLTEGGVAMNLENMLLRCSLEPGALSTPVILLCNDRRPTRIPDTTARETLRPIFAIFPCGPVCLCCSDLKLSSAVLLREAMTMRQCRCTRTTHISADHDSSSGMGSQMSGNALRMEYSMRSRISPGGMSHSETRRTSSKQVRRKGTRPVTLSGTLSDSA